MDLVTLKSKAWFHSLQCNYNWSIGKQAAAVIKHMNPHVTLDETS